MLHIIHKHKIILKLREEKGAWKLQDSISNLYSNSLANLLEPIFDNASSEEEYIRIEKLDLNLGNIRQNDFENHFKERLLAEFSKVLGEVKHTTSENIKVVKQNQSNLDSFIFFLEYGYLPWYIKFEGFSNWEIKLKSSLTSSDWSYFFKWLESEIQNSSVVFDRLIFQFSDDFLTFLLTKQIPVGSDFSLSNFNDIVSLVTFLSNENKTTLRFNTWKTIILQFLKNNNKEDAILEIIKSSVSISTLLSTLNARLPGWTNIFKKVRSDPSEDLVFERIVSLLFIIKSETLTTLSETEIIEKIVNPKKKPAFSINSEIVKTSFLKFINEFAELEGISNSDETSIENNKTKKGKATKNNTADKNIDRGSGKQFDDKNTIPNLDTLPAKKKQLKRNPSLETSGAIVSSCGIVILHPFLKAYFTGLGIYSGNSFATIEQQQRAPLLLNYLATGNKEVAEVDMVLQKLLCGMELSEPIPNSIELTDDEIAESENLLNAIINHWAPLKNTSIQGLQTTFFQREGKLSQTDSSWKLFIENKTVDILLDKLPWGYSTVKLPWMKEILNVEWR